MTSAEFLKQLEQCLSCLQREERENAMAYYREYILEAGENEQEAIEHLGSPQSVAQRIISEIGDNKGVYTPPPIMQNPDAHTSLEPGRVIMTVLIVFFTMPVWITVFSLWIALIFAVCVILLAFACSAVAGPIQGLVEVCSGFTGTGVYDIGAGILCAGLTMLLWKPILLLVVHSSKGIVKLSGNCLNAMLGRRSH